MAEELLTVDFYDVTGTRNRVVNVEYLFSDDGKHIIYTLLNGEEVSFTIKN